MKTLSKVTAASAAALLSLGAISAPAAATSVGDGLSRTLTITESGSGESRTLTYSLTATDTQGRTFVQGESPSAGQIGFSSSSVRACRTQPRTLDPDGQGGATAGCSTFFNNGFSDTTNVTTTFGAGTMTITYTIPGRGGQFDSYMNALSTTRPFAAVSLYIKFHGDTTLYALYGDSDPSVGSASAPAKSDDMDPGVSFAGPLVASAIGRTVDEDTAGTLTFTGKRLHQVTAVTIGGIAVTVTSATRSALVIDFDALPAGRHDVVLTTKAGAKTTLRGFVTVR